MAPSSRSLALALYACSLFCCTGPTPAAPPVYPALTPEAPRPATVERLVDPLAALRAASEHIAAEAQHSRGAYTLLAELCDDIGARISGSVALERALRWAEAHLREAGHDNVRIEPVMVPKWVRGPESLRMTAPEERAFPVLGLGGSVATPKQGITAELFVVSSEQELEQAGDEARGKIVLIDREMPAYDEAQNDPGYGKVFGARVFGPSLAAKHGAVAVLVRSLTAQSLGTLHTGTLAYAPELPKVPAASITIEDAALLHRLFEREKRVVLTLSLASRDEGLAPSGNVIAELRGRERPDEIVLIGGHIDSWDVGQGAHDDGAGVVISMEALSVLRRLGLVPRRTIRAVLFTNEENGGKGAAQYALDHARERHVAAIETDTGGTRVVQIGIDVEEARREQVLASLSPLSSLLAPLGVKRVESGHAGADVAPLKKQGVPTLGLVHDVSHYFDYHHTTADTFDKVDPEELAQGVAAMAVLAYALAEGDFVAAPSNPER